MFVLDTNVISELRKIRSGRTSPAFVKWALASDLSHYYLSPATIIELEIGILRMEKKDPKQAWVLRQWLTDFVQPEFHDRVLPVTSEVAARAAYVFENTTSKSYPDVLIAATAYVHNMVVVTHNKKHFSGAGVRILDPWTA